MRKRLIVFLVVLVLAAGLAQAQSTGLVGVVSDQSGNPLPGASVTVTNNETGLTRTVTSGPGGAYQILRLASGVYEVSAELLGFTPRVYLGIVLTVPQPTNLDIVLRIVPAQSCSDGHVHSGNLILTNQTAVSGVTGFLYTRITGDLRISGQDIQDLESLRCLTMVDGDVRIQLNPLLEKLEGLRSLEVVEGQLILFENNALRELNGLRELTRISDGLRIERNALIVTLAGLSSLVEVGGNLDIKENADLIELEGLHRIQSVPGHVFVLENAALRSLSAFRNLTDVAQNLVVHENPQLVEVKLDALVHTSELDVRGNASLESLGAFNSLNDVNEITIAGNPVLALLPEWPDVTDLDQLTIQDNTLLGRIEFPNLTQIGSAASIEENDKLEEVLFPRLEQIFGTLKVTNNLGLTLLKLPALRILVTGLQIEHNAALETLELDVLDTLFAFVSILDNASLQRVDIRELGNVVLNIAENPELEDFVTQGLEELARFTLRDNSQLLQFDFNAMEVVHGDFSIISNQSLTEAPLSNLRHVGGDFRITGNPHLESCEFVWIAARLGIAETGEITIADNNDDGLLASVEVDNQADLLQATGVRCVSGAVIIRDGIFTDLSPLADLLVVASVLAIGGATLPPAVEFADLALVGHDIRIFANTGAYQLRFPRLETAGRLDINLDDLTALEAPRLEELRSIVVIQNNADLAELDLSDLRHLIGLVIRYNPSLTNADVAQIFVQTQMTPTLELTCGNQESSSCLLVDDFSCVSNP